MKINEFKSLLESKSFKISNLDANTINHLYAFYKYYDINPKGVAAILISGMPGVGKSFFAEKLAEVMGDDAVYLYRQCTVDIGAEELISDLNYEALFNSSTESKLLPGILIDGIKNANNGNKTILVIDEIDKAKPSIDAYLLDFLQSGKIVNTQFNNVVLTEEGRKNLFVVIAKNNQREVNSALIRRVKSVEFNAFTPIQAKEYLEESLLEYSDKFFMLTVKFYEILYKEYYTNKATTLLTRLPSIEELSKAIKEDFLIYGSLTSYSANDRLSFLIDNICKENDMREFLEDEIVKFIPNYNSERYSDISVFDEEVSLIDSVDNLIEDAVTSNLYDSDNVENIISNVLKSGLYKSYTHEGYNEICEIKLQSEVMVDELIILVGNISKTRGEKFVTLYSEGNSVIGLIKTGTSAKMFSNVTPISPTLIAGALNLLYSSLYIRRNQINTKFYSDEFGYKTLPINRLAQSASMRFFDAEIKTNNIDDCLAENKYLSITKNLQNNTIIYKQNANYVTVYDFFINFLEINPEIAFLNVNNLVKLETSMSDFEVNEHIEKYQESDARLLKLLKKILGDYKIIALRNSFPPEYKDENESIIDTDTINSVSKQLVFEKDILKISRINDNPLIKDYYESIK